MTVVKSRIEIPMDLEGRDKVKEIFNNHLSIEDSTKLRGENKMLFETGEYSLDDIQKVESEIDAVCRKLSGLNLSDRDLKKVELNRNSNKKVFSIEIE
jgi:hypothetical protein